MKKLISTLMIICAMAASLIVGILLPLDVRAIQNNNDGSVLYGDANGDGQIDLLDVLLLRKYLANRDPETGESSVVLGPSSKLEFERSGDGTYYIVTGIGAYTDTDVVIPDTYNGLPVKMIGDSAFNGCSSLKSVELPDSVTSIGDCAFYGCSSLTSITIPDSVTSIGFAAFASCSGLTSFTIPDRVTTIDDFAFFECDGLTNITIPDSVTLIDEYAFSECDGLTSVTIGNGATSLGAYAFNGCENLTSITIPDSVTSIGDFAFFMCNRLWHVLYKGTAEEWSAITIGEYNHNLVDATRHYNCTGNEIFDLENKLCAICEATGSVGLEYALNADGTYTVTGLGTCTDLDVRIPETYMGAQVTAIGDKAFAEETAITSIQIPDSVKSIGTRAFYGCSGITEITIPASVTSIGTQIFYKADSLHTVYYNSTYRSQDNPFLIVENIKKIVFGGTYIPSYMCYNAANIEEVVIIDSVTSIGSDAFYGCSGLTSVHINDLTSWCRIEFDGSAANPLYYAHNLYLNGELVTELVIPDGVTTISSHAFYGCTSLTSVVIPDSFTSIGYSVFYGCSSLTSVHIEDLAAWCGIYFPNSGDNPLCYAHNLYLNGELVTNLVIPDGVTSIAKWAFCDCSGLTSITIPDTVTSIGYGAFYGCSSLTSITIPDSVTSIGDYAFRYCRSLTSITIPDSVTSIGYGAFDGCSSLTSISIPDSVTSIAKWAFCDCSGLTSITIPDTVTSIGYGAFRGCNSLTSITIPNGVTSIGGFAFAGCNNLEDITLPFVGNQAGVTSGDTYQYPFGYIFGTSSYTGGTATRQYYYGSSTSSTTYNTYYIPASLKSVTITGGQILYGAFFNCSSLTDITIPGSATSIGSHAFYGCSRLNSITIPDSVTSIGSYTFYGCSSLTSVTIPDSVTRIDEFTFSGCSSLTSITIPDGVTIIGSSAFSYCSSLTSVTIPDSVTSIGEFAFWDCSSLANITFAGTMKQWEAITFGSYWNLGVPATEVVCSDGTVRLFPAGA